MHPHIFLTAETMDGLRSLADLRASIRQGQAKELWQQILALADAARNSDPLLPGSSYPGRNPVQVKHGNRDSSLCTTTGLRLRATALAGLVTGDPDYCQAAVRQLEALFDDQLWPDWRDLAHLKHPADLRTGSLGRDIGLTFDWLYPMLNQAQRSWIIEGLSCRAFAPFWQSVEQGCFWVNGSNNWMTCIVGGLGIAAMALGKDYPPARDLIDFSLPRMRGYLAVYGKNGEFNESVGYAGSSLAPITYFMAQRYHSGNHENIVGQPPFTEFCRWYQYFTVPPGKIVDFGDSHSGAPPNVAMFPAVAQAARDGILQNYYLQHSQTCPRRVFDLELLWLDQSLKPRDPSGILPRGRAFPEHSGNISSHTDWHPRKTACVVYGKAGHGSEGHGHHDAGQVCIDGHGERLIIDLGNPAPIYPADFFSENRYRYYNAGVYGHNVLTFGGREMRCGPENRGLILKVCFDDATGGWWQVETTALYDRAKRVIRTVAHLFPGFVAVLDQAVLRQTDDISLRWHTIDRAIPDREGKFTVHGDQAGLTARVINLGQDQLTVRRQEHAYQPPFDRCRLGDPLRQRHESFVEARMQAYHCHLLTLFAVYGPEEPAGTWQTTAAGWSIKQGATHASVSLEDTEIHLQSSAGELNIPLPIYPA